MGTKKGMVRKTARKAYVKKAKSGSVAAMAKKAASFGKKKSGKYLMQDAKKGKKVVKKARNSARMNRLEELGRIDAEKKNKNRMAEKRRVVRELNAKKGKKVPKGMHRMPNGKLMKNSDMKKAGNGMMKKAGSGMKKATYGAMKKAKSGLKKAPAGPKGKGMRSLPKDVRNKIGFAKKGTKKGMVRKTARKAYMKKGGSTRKCKSGCK
jgi:hypothetical protein